MGEEGVIKGSAVPLLRWPIDPNDADGLIEQGQINPQDAPAIARSGMPDRVSEVASWSEDDCDALGVPATRRVEELRAGPDSARSCLNSEEICGVRIQMSLRENCCMCTLLPQPVKAVKQFATS